MAVPEGGVTRWFRNSEGKTVQVDKILGMVLGSPLIASGYYRDKPPLLAGSAALGSGENTIPLAISSGVDPIAFEENPGIYSLIGASSILEDDDFTHEDLRFIFYPVPIIFIKTFDDLISALPTDSSFSLTRPTPNFEVFDFDCMIPWGEGCTVFNVAPPGWSVGDSQPEQSA